MNLASKDIEREHIRQAFANRDAGKEECAKVQAYFDRCRRDAFEDLLGGRESASSAILDLGCGHGDWMMLFRSRGVEESKLHGVDLSQERVDQATTRLPGATFAVGCGSELEYEDGVFDGVVISLVFSSILDDAMCEDLLAEAWRVLAPGGWLFVHDMHYSGPKSRTRRFAFRDLQVMLGSLPASSEKKELILLPFLARTLLKVAPFSVRVLEKLPFLRGHWMARIDKECEA